MRVTFYFLTTGTEVIAGPFFSVIQATNHINKLAVPLRGIVRVMKTPATFILEEV